MALQVEKMGCEKHFGILIAKPAATPLVSLTCQHAAVYQSCTLWGWLRNCSRCWQCIDLQGSSVRVCTHTYTRSRTCYNNCPTLIACEIQDMNRELSSLWLTEKSVSWYMCLWYQCVKDTKVSSQANNYRSNTSSNIWSTSTRFTDYITCFVWVFFFF